MGIQDPAADASRGDWIGDHVQRDRLGTRQDSIGRHDFECVSPDLVWARRDHQLSAGGQL